MQSEFRGDTHTSGRTITLSLSGQLDLVSSAALKRSMHELVSSDAELIVVDLRGVEFMDSTALHLLLEARLQAHESGRRFALIRGPEQVQRVFDLTGMTGTLTIVDAPEQLLEVDQAPDAPRPAG
jgi:anti-sigma B factor antagonist